jgi:hypothetical protein
MDSGSDHGGQTFVYEFMNSIADMVKDVKVLLIFGCGPRDDFCHTIQHLPFGSGNFVFISASVISSIRHIAETEASWATLLMRC